MIIFIGKTEDLYLIDDLIEQESHEVVNDICDINIIVNRYKNATHYSQIIINVDLFYNSATEIANALFLLKSANNTNIVVIAQGYDVGDELLSELVANGIYNFVLSFDKTASHSEMEDCINGIDLDTVRHYINVETLEQKSLFRLKKATFKTITIGVCGVCNRIGTTTQALRLAKWIEDSGHTVCYCEQNSNGHIEVIKNIYPDAKYRGGYIEYQGLHLYYKSKPSPTAYNYIIYDYGTDISQLDSCDLKLIIAGCTAWEMMFLSQAITKLENMNSVSYVFSFISQSEKDDILDFMDTKWSTTYFAEYSPDMFASITETEKELYGKIIDVKLGKARINKPISPTKNKLSIFGKKA